MPRIPFPNVPQLPGVPQLLRSPNFPPSLPPVVGAVLSVGRIALAFIVGSGWGVYRARPPTQRNAEGIEEITSVGQRVPVVEPDSFTRFDYTADWDIATAPIQDGGFANFDKVDNPEITVLRMSKGGSARARKEFIDTLKSIAGTLDLFDIITPEQTYTNVNIRSVAIRRDGARHAYFLQDVDVLFQEIRFVTPEYSTTVIGSEGTAADTANARMPDAQPVTNVGLVQGLPTRGLL